MRILYDSATHATPYASRRREPRVEVDGTISAVCLSVDGLQVISVHDIGFRGFAIETREPVAVRLRARFEFRSDAGALVVADAVSVHCHRSLTTADCWISGWEFPEQPGLDASLGQLVDGALDVLSFE